MGARPLGAPAAVLTRPAGAARFAARVIAQRAPGAAPLLARRVLCVGKWNAAANRAGVCGEALHAAALALPAGAAHFATRVVEQGAMGAAPRLARRVVH